MAPCSLIVRSVSCSVSCITNFCHESLLRKFMKRSLSLRKSGGCWEPVWTDIKFTRQFFVESCNTKAWFEVLTSVLVKIRVFRDVALCYCVISFLCFGLLIERHSVTFHKTSPVPKFSSRNMGADVLSYVLFKIFVHGAFETPLLSRTRHLETAIYCIFCRQFGSDRLYI